MMLGSRSRRLLFLTLASLLAGCGGDKSPTQNTPPTTVAVVPSPSPAGPPPPDPFPGATSCNRIGLGTATGVRCGVESPAFLDQLSLAIDQVINEKPQIFEGGGNSTRVLSTGQFYVAVINNLDRMGLCAVFDGEELGIKAENSFNDQYHLVTSSFIVRRGNSSYQTTCHPAAFPTPAPPYPPSNGCALPSSREVTCGRETATYIGDVNAALDQVGREHPDVVDVTNVRGTEGGYKIIDAVRFKTFTLEAMKARGYCARHDGEEFIFKKANVFSEHYDLESSEGFVRRGGGTYETSCYPAAF
jgi:hypothetical protein